jgi:hypothetical protein
MSMRDGWIMPDAEHYRCVDDPLANRTRSLKSIRLLPHCCWPTCRDISLTYRFKDITKAR